MKLNITIEYQSGESAVATVLPPDWVKWESKFDRKISDLNAGNIGMSDLCFLAYCALKRESGGTFKPYDAWIETVKDVDAERNDPKATSLEA